MVDDVEASGLEPRLGVIGAGPAGYSQATIHKHHDPVF
jgi:hypothetical protein